MNTPAFSHAPRALALVTVLFLPIAAAEDGDETMLVAPQEMAQRAPDKANSAAAAKPAPVQSIQDTAPSATSATTPAPEPAAATATAEPMLALGIGDVVSVQVYGRPELSTTTYVSDDGSVSVPLAGAVAVAGLSPAKASQTVASEFRKKKLLVDPQVTVFLVQNRSQQVSVLGAVKTPGRFAVDSKTTVLDVLAQAGGTTENGSDKVMVLRPGKGGKVTRFPVDLKGLGQADMPLPALTLRGGDSIFVPPAEQFSIHGEVKAPNMYRLESGMTVVQAIARSGGVTPRGSSNRIEIRHSNADGSFVTRDGKLNDAVLPNDVIRVKERIF